MGCEASAWAARRAWYLHVAPCEPFPLWELGVLPYPTIGLLKKKRDVNRKAFPENSQTLTANFLIPPGLCRQKITPTIRFLQNVLSASPIQPTFIPPGKLGVHDSQLHDSTQLTSWFLQPMLGSRKTKRLPHLQRPIATRKAATGYTRRDKRRPE